MRVRTILSLCCFLALLFTGAALFAEPAASAAPLLNTIGAAPVCPVSPVGQTSGPVADSACPVNLWQQCYQRYGTCALCFCLGSSCECENRCV